MGGIGSSNIPTFLTLRDVISSHTPGDGEIGRWGDGEMGRRGDGEMGRWGDREMGRISSFFLLPSSFFLLPSSF